MRPNSDREAEMTSLSDVARIWRLGEHRESGGWKSPSWVRGRAPSGGKRGFGAFRILRIFGCQAMHNFVYLAAVHESLVKHEKNLGCSACSFAELSSD